jgi:hypothetical protein
MTQINILEQKKERLMQLKNRIREEETLLKAKERKARTRRLIELGGLVTKAQLDHLPSNTLYGSLLHIKEQLANNAKLQAQWAHQGGAAFSKSDIPKTAVIVSFSEKPSADLCIKLRALGLKWNNIRQEWQGHTILQEVTDLLQDQKAVVQEVKH